MTSRRHLTLVPPPPPPPPTVPCQLCYLDQRLAWWSCGQPVPVGRELEVAGRPRVVCAEHRGEVGRVQEAGLADRLRWAKPAPTGREPVHRPAVGVQLALLPLPPPTRRRLAAALPREGTG